MIQHPITNLVTDEILIKKPMHRKFLNRALSKLTKEESSEAENYLRFLVKEGVAHKKIADSYLTIVNDIFKEELYFRKNGSYRFSSFAEVESVVYANEDYMQRYMIGLALSTFWWSNHTQVRRFFQSKLHEFQDNKGVYREVGPGHGMFFLETLRNCCFKYYEGIDISSTSVNMTNSVITSGSFGNFDDRNVKIIEADFFEGDELIPADVMVMGEVLEHVEEPGKFLEQAYRTTTDDTFFFLTTCINSPAIDHLYNPETIENLENLFSKYGFYVRDKCIVPRDGATLDECEKNKLTINLAYVLVKTKQ